MEILEFLGRGEFEKFHRFQLLVCSYHSFALAFDGFYWDFTGWLPQFTSSNLLPAWGRRFEIRSLRSLQHKSLYGSMILWLFLITFTSETAVMMPRLYLYWRIHQRLTLDSKRCYRNIVYSKLFRYTVLDVSHQKIKKLKKTNCNLHAKKKEGQTFQTDASSNCFLKPSPYLLTWNQVRIWVSSQLD